MRTVTLKVVAHVADVSLSTASRVLSGSDYPVAPELRQRVEEAARALDYVPNAQAQGLHHGNPRAIGVLVGDISDPYFGSIVAGIHRAASEFDALVTTVNTYRDSAAEVAAFRQLHGHRFGTIIVAGSGIQDPDYRKSLGARVRSFQNEGNVAVLIGRHAAGTTVPRVEVDNVGIMRDVGKYLQTSGHRSVLVLAGDQRITSTTDRIKGLRAGLGSRARISVVVSGGTRDGGWSATKRAFEDCRETTALVATADQIAIGAMAALRELAIRVPEDVSVIGCNDIWFSRDTVPSLTTVRLPLDEMGAAAVRLGIAAREGGILRQRFAGELILRDSSGPVRKDIAVRSRQAPNHKRPPSP